MTKTITRWAITYKRGKDSGIYTGQYLTRADAVRDHVESKGLGPHEKDYARFIPFDLYTKDEITQGWRYWRKQGDRAVKVKITYPA